MAPLLFALLLLAQDASAATPGETDGPVATAAPRKETVAPLPIQGGPVSPPTDDYGYVAWCYGAVGGYVDLYDRAMPEVIRIERAWPTPSTEENIKEVYPAQKKEAASSLALFRRAIEAAEKASPNPIQNQGAAAIKKGRAVWTGSTTVPKAQLAQFWMSWSPPSKCEETAKALEARSNLFGQALTFNAAAPTPVEPEATAPAVETAETVETVASPTEPATEEMLDVADAAAPDAQDDMPMDAVKDEAVAGEVAGSAIDDLLSGSTEMADEAVEEAAAPAEAPKAAPAPKPVAAKPKPAVKKPTAKPGLKDTLAGMRGRQ